MIEQETLAVIWFALLWFVFASYLVLDGFDLGVGISYLWATSSEKDEMREAIGPFWDGNETWLVLFAGILFAAFPMAYGDLLSEFYECSFLLLFSLIFRGASLEFRSLVSRGYLRKFWDVSFFVSSLAIPMLFGVVIANVLIGIESNKNGEVHSKISFLSLWNLQAILTGVYLSCLLALHGANFIILKLGDKSSEKYRRFAFMYCICAFVLLCSLFMFSGSGLDSQSVLGLIFTLCIIAGNYYAILKQKCGIAFVLSAATIILSVISFAMLLYPNIGLSQHLTIYNTMSSQGTLARMLIFAIIGMPFVFAYTYMSYRIFWKK